MILNKLHTFHGDHFDEKEVHSSFGWNHTRIMFIRKSDIRAIERGEIVACRLCGCGCGYDADADADADADDWYQRVGRILELIFPDEWMWLVVVHVKIHVIPRQSVYTVCPTESYIKSLPFPPLPFTARAVAGREEGGKEAEQCLLDHRVPTG
jgi:hypothetical protein